MKLWTVFIAIHAGATAIAQVSLPNFESATIMASQQPDARSRYATDPKKLTLQNQTLKDCVRIAYGVKVVRLAAEGPKWIETQRFDIEVDAASVAEDRELKAMLRALLEERFKLTVHRETKVLPGYALVAAKGGLKVRAVEPGPSRMSTSRGSMTGENASMANFAQALSDVMNTPVTDSTGAPGVFNFALEWTPDLVQPGSLTADEQEPTVLPDMPRGPSLFGALQDQLGLKLMGRKVTLEVLLIDQAERLRD
jgi:uncharacterized protein (TIGR03435 family)